MQKPKQLVAVLGLLTFLGASRVRADPAITEAAQTRSPVTLGLGIGGSRYDNDYQSYYQATLVPSMAVDLGDDLSLEGAMPVTGGFTPNSSCCRRSLGNATFGFRYRRMLGGGLSLTIPGSLSLPTASSGGEARRNALYTATAELTRMPGLFLPDTVSGRLAAEGSYQRGRLRARLRIGTTLWSTDTEPGRSTTVVFPVSAEVGWQALDSLVPSVGLRSLTNPDAESPIAASAEVGTSYRHGPAVYRLTLALPIDAESRERSLLSIIGAMSWQI